MADHYRQVANHLLTPLLELLRLSREHCGGDIDKFLVILVVALRTNRQPEFIESTAEQLISGDVAILPGLGTNVRSIAESLNIPKETVRRKVGELVDTGWLARRRARLYFTAKADQQLAPVREQVERLAICHYEVVAALRTKTQEHS